MGYRYDCHIVCKYARKRKFRLLAAKRKGCHMKCEWEEMKAFFKGRCVRCWEKSSRIEKDHIIPIYMGGSDAIENIQPICKSCNCAKRDETINWKRRRLKLMGKTDRLFIWKPLRLSALGVGK